jgi:hypothetical protein
VVLLVLVAVLIVPVAVLLVPMTTGWYRRHRTTGWYRRQVIMHNHWT